jgi:hypothetical protein
MNEEKPAPRINRKLIKDQNFIRWLDRILRVSKPDVITVALDLRSIQEDVSQIRMRIADLQSYLGQIDASLDRMTLK